MAISVQALRDEGVLDIGGISGTSFVYVVTRARTCLFHARELPNRRLDTYGALRAVYWLTNGTPSSVYAARIGVTEPELRRALLSIGYARLSTEPQASRRGKKRKFGNRRGQLVAVTTLPRTRSSPALGRSPNPLFNEKSANVAIKKKKPRGIVALERSGRAHDHSWHKA